MSMNSYHGAAVRSERIEHGHFDIRGNDGKSKAQNASNVGSANSWYHEAAVKEVLKQSPGMRPSRGAAAPDRDDQRPRSPGIEAFACSDAHGSSPRV